MTGYATFICPICGKEWRLGGNLDFTYVFSYCLCKETIEEFRKADKLCSITTVYANLDESP